MIEIIILWVGMYFLLEIIAFTIANKFAISRVLELELDDSARDWLNETVNYSLCLILAPAVAMYCVYQWFKIK